MCLYIGMACVRVCVHALVYSVSLLLLYIYIYSNRTHTAHHTHVHNVSAKGAVIFHTRNSSMRV